MKSKKRFWGRSHLVNRTLYQFYLGKILRNWKQSEWWKTLVSALKKREEKSEGEWHLASLKKYQVVEEK